METNSHNDHNSSGSRWVEWVEPFGPFSEPMYCCVSASAAISAQKVVAQIKGFVYQSDQEALDDFMSIHWACFT